VTKLTDTIAKTVRILSIPPLMISLLMVVLAYCRHDIINSTTQLGVALLLLGGIPASAYFLCNIIPKYKKEGRNGQRKLAFITNLIGYGLAILWSYVYDTNDIIKIICSSYFIACMLLTVCNKCLNIRASGHASSFTGPLIFSFCYLDIRYAIVFLIFSILIVWSSLHLKRHTVRELVCGAGIFCLSFYISVLIV